LPLGIETGREIVGLARKTLVSFVSEGEVQRGVWKEGPLSIKRGAFVTLNILVKGEHQLRGCIGFPLPVKPLGEAVREATVLAASEDPRFPPVESSELGMIMVEVSALTVPETIRAARREELCSEVRVGTDGLVVSRGPYSGLLLPQVATEYGLDSQSFLVQACMKAGLPPDAWLHDGVEVQRFQAEVFAEEKPNGPVRRVSL
jgi:uncharacterized protein